jgi:peroxiredoxin
LEQALYDLQEANMIKVDEKAPDFTLQSDNGDSFRLSEHAGEKILLVFYPGDNTPVCTAQLCEYRDGIEEFSGLGVTVVGISSDDLESHREFRRKHDLPFILLSDTDLSVAKLYDSKGVMGMKRSVFLVDEQGVIRYAHIETLALFRRRSEELIEAISALEAGEGD